MNAVEGMQQAEAGWQDDVFRVLKSHGVKHVVYVPDAGHSTAIRLAEADSDIHSVVLTTEEEGIGYLAGAWLGGERGALLMQSSGVGNCINTLALAGLRPVPAADGDHHARRLGGVQRLAEPDGPGDREGAQPDGRHDLARRRAGGRRASAARRRDDGLQWRRQPARCCWASA